MPVDQRCGLLEPVDFIPCLLKAPYRPYVLTPASVPGFYRISVFRPPRDRENYPHTCLSGFHLSSYFLSVVHLSYVSAVSYIADRFLF